MIELQNVSLEYITGNIKTTPVNNVSLSLNDGDFTAVIGASGSGKSSLAKVLCGLVKPSAGKVLYNGTDIFSLKRDDLAYSRLKFIGQVFQDFRLIDSLSVTHNVLLPFKLLNGRITKEARERARHLLATVRLAERANHHPYQLSGGQQQRVAIARALINDPSLLMADEPTGNLDSKSSDDIARLFCALHSAGTAIFVVTHDPDMAKLAQRTVMFRDGEIQEIRVKQAADPLAA